MTEKLLQFTSCGLVFDVAGVLLLGSAFFLKTKKAIVKEASSMWDSNPHVLRSLAASKLDGICGTSLLFIGFIYQIIGHLGITNIDITLTSYIMLVIFILIYIVNFRKRIVNKWCEKFSELFE